MLISVIIQIRSKLNDRIVKSDASLTKLGGKTYIIRIVIPSFPCMYSSYWRVSEVNPTWLGASHAEELPLVLGWPFDENILKYKAQLTDEEKALSYHIIKMWTNFAKTGWGSFSSRGNMHI